MLYFMNLFIVPAITESKIYHLDFLPPDPHHLKPVVNPLYLLNAKNRKAQNAKRFCEQRHIKRGAPSQIFPTNNQPSRRVDSQLQVFAKLALFVHHSECLHTELRLLTTPHFHLVHACNVCLQLVHALGAFSIDIDCA